MELWDLYNADRKPLHRTHQRGTPLTVGEYHMVVSIWTVNHANEILLTLRDAQKEWCPNKWENTGGSVMAGETSLQAAVRELREETGLQAVEKDLMQIRTRQTDFEWIDSYLLCRDASLSDLILQPGETVDAKWITVSVFEEMARQDLIADASVQEFVLCKSKILAGMEK